MAAALADARKRLQEAQRMYHEAVEDLASKDYYFHEAKEEGLANAGELKELEDEAKIAETMAATAQDAVDTAFNAVEAAEKAAAAEAARVHPCSLPGCTNPAHSMCGKCLSAYYCSQEHQKADWNRHKRECRILSAKAGGRRKSRRSKRSKRSHRKTKRRY
jgi:hypothetical protein